MHNAATFILCPLKFLKGALPSAGTIFDSFLPERSIVGSLSLVLWRRSARWHLAELDLLES